MLRLLCWVDRADVNTHLKEQCLNINDNDAWAGCHPGAAMVQLILGIKVKGRERFLEAVVLELNNNHSFSFLPLQTPRKRLGTCIALVLILGMPTPLEAKWSQLLLREVPFSPYSLAPVELSYVVIRFILLKIQSPGENMIMLFSDSCVWKWDGLNQLAGIIGAQGPANPWRAAVWAEILIILMTLLPILSAS